ncbi:MAG: PilZ domain-containing protein [Eubacteriales bacterium]|nr:PilZ domain-containing protein [Eubacteriales bacterium]
MKVDFVKTFSVSEKVEIYVLSGQVGAGNYRTLVADVTPEYLEIETPVTGGHFVPLKPGSTILLVQIKLDAIYTYQFKIDAVNKSNIESFIIKEPEKVKRIQRRSFFRVEYPFKMEIMSAVKKVNKNINRKREEYLTHDLSGGGLSFYSYIKDNHSLFRMEDDYFVKIYVNDKTYYFKGNIVRQQSLENKRELIAIKINDINKKSREQIIRSLFIKQNELLQKGIL